MPKSSTYSLDPVDTYSLMPDTGSMDTYTLLPDLGQPPPTYSLVPDTGGGSSPGSDDWESMLDSGQLDQSLDRLSLYSQPRPQVKILTDDCRTQYKPPSPKLTILKRPSSQPASNGQARQKAPTKTLEQREADYAQARQRILGKDGTQQQQQQGRGKVQLKQKQNPPKNKDGVAVQPVAATRNPRGTDGTKGFSARQGNQPASSR